MEDIKADGEDWKKPRSLTLYAVGEKISWDASNMFQPIWGWLEED